MLIGYTDHVVKDHVPLTVFFMGLDFRNWASIFDL